MADEVTTGELSRRFDSLERSIDRRLTEINRSIESLSFVNKEVYERDLKEIWAAIGEIVDKDKRRTAWIATGVILPVILIVVLQVLQLQ